MSAAPIDVGTLAARFAQRLRIFGRRHLRDAAAAEDLAQETLRRVFEAVAAGRVRDPAALGGFVYETANHVVQQYYRTRQREQRAFAKLDRAEEDPATSPLVDLISAQRREAVRRALAQLDPTDRTLLVWIYHEGVDVAEAAGRLAIEAGTLRVRKHRALRRLGALLAAGPETPALEREPERL